MAGAPGRKGRRPPSTGPAPPRRNGRRPPVERAGAPRRKGRRPSREAPPESSRRPSRKAPPPMSKGAARVERPRRPCRKAPCARFLPMADLDHFFSLARQGQLAALREFIEELEPQQRVECLTYVDPSGDTALFIAIQREYPNVVELLLSYDETDPNHKNMKGDTALSLSSRINRPYLARCVLHRLLAVDQLQQGKLVTLTRLSEIVKSVKGNSIVRWAFAQAALIDFYSELSIEQLALCVVHSFKHRPAMCLYECVSLAAAVAVRAKEVRSLDPARAEELEGTSAHLQLAAAGCLDALYMIKDGLGRYEVDELLQSPLSEAAIKLAIRYQCRALVAQQPLQAFLMREWRGPLLQEIIEHADTDLFRIFVGIIGWICVALLNLLLLPFFVAAPHLEIRLVNHLKAQAAKEVIAKAAGTTRAKKGKGGSQTGSDRSRSSRNLFSLKGLSCSRLLGSRRRNLLGSQCSLFGSQRSLPSSIPSISNSRSLPPDATPVSDDQKVSVGDNFITRREQRALDGSVTFAANPAPAPSPPSSPPNGSNFPMRNPPIVNLPANIPSAVNLPAKAPSAAPPIRAPAPAVALPMMPTSLLFTYQKPLLHYYLLRVPILKFGLRLCSDVSLAALVTFVSFEGSTWHIFIYCVWPAGGLVSEYAQLIAAEGSLWNEVLSWMKSDTPSTYRADLFNPVDMISLHLLLFAFIAYYYWPGAHIPLRAFAALTLCLRLLRLIYLSQTLGSLVLLLVRMTQDMIHLFVLIGFIIIALTSALNVLISEDDQGFTKSYECLDFVAFRGDWRTWHGVAFILINAVLDGKAQDALLLCSVASGPIWWLGWVFAYFFFVFVVLLLLNMMIAMFTRTFDVFFDSMIEHVQTNFARAVLAWCASSPEPPPLNLLRLPTDLWKWVNALHGPVKSVASQPMLFRGSPAARRRASTSLNALVNAEKKSKYLLGNTFSGMGLQAALRELVWGPPNLCKKKSDFSDYKGIPVRSHSVGSRNAWEIWKERDNQELVVSVTNFILRHENMELQEERWRLKMMRRISAKFADMDRAFAGVFDELRDIKNLLAPVPQQNELAHEVSSSDCAGG